MDQDWGWVQTAEFITQLLDSVKGARSVDELLRHARVDADHGAISLAINAFEQALKLDPANAPAANGLAWTLSTALTQWRQPTQAVQWARRAVELAPDVASYWNTLGTALYRSGEFSDAIQALETSLRLDPQSGVSHNKWVLALCLARLGDWDRASRVAEEAKDWWKSHDQNSASWQAELQSFAIEWDVLNDLNKHKDPD